MIQKHISLPEELDQKIQQRAKLLKESEDRVIKELIEQGLQATKPWRNSGEALSSLTRLGLTGPQDLAINHDHYLYEDYD